jgi:hypothetical protein
MRPHNLNHASAYRLTSPHARQIRPIAQNYDRNVIRTNTKHRRLRAIAAAPP